MQEPTHERRPGQLFIDRYMPNANEQEREDAYQNLRELVAILVEVDDRVTQEKCGLHDSQESQP